MVDQFNALGISNPVRPDGPGKKAASSTGAAQGRDFQSLLMDSIKEVNRLQAEADQAMTNLATNRTDNVAEVFTAVKKAELAFQTLMQIRNKLENAYEEIRQMRV